ncbi:phospholipase ABHD3-like isoform X2 [Penaeus monodon]|uniref:phospholipase ABHD3-like isoform X2 n=1 Tax=Penaeus monodon TaxID=6687 RepID=UPI0018A77D68|nr:phospholipase ABHD3-like isoform X2 [Penaeus monodon]
MEWQSLYSDCPRVVLGLTIGAGFLIYYLVEAVKRPLVASRDSAWRDFLEENLVILQERYWPTPWCLESRLQTVLASILRYRLLPRVTYRKEVLQLRDGGQVCLDWLDGAGGANSPIILILPGLTGSSQSDYIKGLVLTGSKTGARCVVLNYRGTAGIELKTTRTYCAANSDDLEEALQHLRTTYPNVPLIAAGVSLGASIIGNYLTTRGEQAGDFLVAAVVFSTPWNMQLGVKSMERPLCNLLLNRYLVACLCGLVSSMSYQLAGDHKWNYDHVMKSKSFREFDSRFTAMQFGFRDAEDYYKTSSLHEKLDDIRVPLLCLNAADDPFQPMEGVPVEAAKRSSHVALVVTARGGHIGFMEGFLPTCTYYSDRLFLQVVNGIFANLDKMVAIKKEANDFARRKALESTSKSS